MVYSNHFVMAVIVDGLPQTELGNGVVKVPFNSEYYLRFRNKNNRRASVKIFIDGENVSGNGYIVNANDKIDIKRHHDIDRAFKFVSLESSEAVEFGKNGPNTDKIKGTIEARFYLEKETVKEIHHHHHYPTLKRDPWRVYPTDNPKTRTKSAPRRSIISYDHPATTCEETLDGLGIDLKMRDGSLNRTVSAQNFVSPSYTGPERVLASKCLSAPASVFEPKIEELLKDGCTVEGNLTGQSFYTVSFEAEETYTSLKVFLQGFDPVVQSAVEPTKKKQTIKDNRTNELEAENADLRRQLAELENQKLKEELRAKQSLL